MARSFDRAIVDCPIAPAVWKLAWPTMLQNVIGGLQGIIDHALVGHLVGYTGNAAIGVSLQIFIVVIVFVSSLFTGMSVLVARFAGADQPEKVNRTVYQAFLASVALCVGVLAPLGWALSPALLRLVCASCSPSASGCCCSSCSARPCARPGTHAPRCAWGSCSPSSTSRST
jgi:Na+-driven multidrug efflux pump